MSPEFQQVLCPQNSNQVSADSGKTFIITPVTLYGDVGAGIRSGTGKSIVWDAGKDCPGMFGTQFQLRVIANEGMTLTGQFVLVPAGEFKMGDNFGEGTYDERPVHSVMLNTYSIGMYEVTNAEYIEFLRDALSKSSITITGNDVKLNDGNYCYQLNYSPKTINYSSGSFSVNETFRDHPVVMVTWYGAVAFCNWHSDREGLKKCYDAGYTLTITNNGYRLPTEAEWEKAARGTDQRRYPWDKAPDGSYANYSGSGDPFETGSYPYTTPVGYYNGNMYGNFSTKDNASPYGAYDMGGNVWEWCHDWYDSNYYVSSPSDNPTGASSGSLRALRGSSWVNEGGFLRSALRYAYYPFNRNYSIGYRCVRSNTGYGSSNIFTMDMRTAVGVEIIGQVPADFELYQNYPNPFNALTKIRFSIQEHGNIEIDIYGLLGKHVKSLYHGYMTSGTYEMEWNAINNYGQPVSSGAYFCRLKFGNSIIVKKLQFVK